MRSARRISAFFARISCAARRISRSPLATISRCSCIGWVAMSAAAAVQDFVPIDNDRFAQAVLADIGHELIKLSALNQRENVCDRMKFDRGHLKSSKLSPSGP